MLHGEMGASLGKRGVLLSVIRFLRGSERASNDSSLLFGTIWGRVQRPDDRAL